MKYTVNNPICPICTGYREELMVDGVKWVRCMSCGHMEVAK